MTWIDFYLICFLVGFVLSLVSALMGAFDLHIPGLDGALHGDVQGDLPAGDVPSAPHGHLAGGPPQVSPFNFSTAMAFLAWFGGAGYLLTKYSGIWSLLALAIAGVAGLVGAGIVFLFLVKVFLRHDFTLDPADYSYVGALGTVNVSIREGGTGEVVFSLGGTRQTAGARSENGAAIPQGAEVVITRYEGGIAYVRRWEEEVTGESAALGK